MRLNFRVRVDHLQAYQDVRIDILNHEVANVINRAVSFKFLSADAFVISSRNKFGGQERVVRDDGVQVSEVIILYEMLRSTWHEMTHPSKSPPPSIDARDLGPVIVNQGVHKRKGRLYSPTDGRTTQFLRWPNKHNLPSGGFPIARTRWTQI